MGKATVVPRISKLATRAVRVAIYIRVSTAEQVNGYGLEVQEQAGQSFVRDKHLKGLDWDIVKIYRDEGVSGKLIDRPGMRELEQDVIAGKIDVIIVHKFDRIGRTGRAFWTWVWAMEDLGVKFVSITQECDTTTQAGDAQMKLFAMFAEMEYNLIRERTQSGRQAKAQDGGWPGGPPPYGYAIQGKGKKGSTLVINPDEAAVIELIAELMIDKGLTMNETARELNRLGKLTRSGRAWTGGNLGKRLRSDSLDGQVIFRRTDGKNGHGRTIIDQDGNPVNGDTVIIEIPRTLSEERTLALKACLGVRAWEKTDPDHVYPLSGRLFARCGKAYVGAWSGYSDDRLYACQGKQSADPCSDLKI